MPIVIIDFHKLFLFSCLRTSKKDEVVSSCITLRVQYYMQVVLTRISIHEQEEFFESPEVNLISSIAEYGEKDMGELWAENEEEEFNDEP